METSAWNSGCCESQETIGVEASGATSSSSDRPARAIASSRSVRVTMPRPEGVSTKTQSTLRSRMRRVASLIGVPAGTMTASASTASPTRVSISSPRSLEVSVAGSRLALRESDSRK